jgi:hypothetical protein
MGWVVSATPRPFTPGKDLVPIVQEAGCAPGRSGRVQIISPPPGFDSRTVQPVASRYTYCAHPAPYLQARNRNGTRGFGGHRLQLRILFFLIYVHVHARSCVSCIDYAWLAVVKYEYGAMME